MIVRKIIVLSVFLSFCISAEENVNDEQGLKNRCLASFKMIETKNYTQFLQEIPNKKLSKQEVNYSKKILDRAYNKWFVRSKIKNVTVRDVSYKEPSAIKKSRFNAIKQAAVNLKVFGESSSRHADCDFILISGKWYMSSLP